MARNWTVHVREGKYMENDRTVPHTNNIIYHLNVLTLGNEYATHTHTATHPRPAIRHRQSGRIISYGKHNTIAI